MSGVHRARAADIDGDGDIDIVTGYFSIDKSANAWVDVWTNERKKPTIK